MIEWILALLGIRRAAVAATAKKSLVVRPVGDERIVAALEEILIIAAPAGAQFVCGDMRTAMVSRAAMRTYQVDLIERIEEGRN